MKLTVIFLLIGFLQANAKSYGQATINLNVKDMPLEKVFSEIKKQSGYDFFYDNNLLAITKKVTVRLKGATIEQALKETLKDQPLDFRIVDQTISIKRKIESPSDEIKSANPPTILSKVTGIIKNSRGEPLPSASVYVKNTNHGTSTNEKGVFELTAIASDAIFEISYSGYQTQELPIQGQIYISVILQISKNSLDQVQVIAYGTTTKRLSVGNISSINGTDINKQPVTNPLLAIEGRVPGLFITQENGFNGGPVTLRVQGQNSIGNGNDPFIVIDGVPYPSSMPLTGLENTLSGSDQLPSTPSPLNFINPSDIESVDVLKDADATAIFGSRAANGAILITTRKGKAGKNKVEINLQNGWGQVARKVDMLNTRQYLDMRYEAFRNDNIDWTKASVSANDLKIWDTTRYTNWQKTLIGGASQYSNINAAVSGGTTKIQYLVAGTYLRQTTVFPGNFADQRGSVHFNLNTLSENEKFRMQVSANYMIDDNHLPGTDLTQKAVLLEPDAPNLYNSDGTLNWAPKASGSSTWSNPLVPILYQKYNNTTDNLISNLQFSYAIIKGIELKSSFGYTKLETDDFLGTPLTAIRPESRLITPRTAKYGTRQMNSWIVEPQITFKEILGKGQLEGVIGTSIQQNISNANSIKGTGYTSDESLQNPGDAATITEPSPNYAMYKYNGLFGRCNYIWGNKYILDITARRDGSSRFGPKNQFHNFGSIGGAWIFTQERIFQQSVSTLSFGKVRGSYGITGNDQIGDYTFLPLYNNTYADVPYQNSTGLLPSGIINPYLEWEETKKMQMGIDLGFLRDNLLLSITYSRNRSSNELLYYALPSVTGFIGIPGNFPATVQNRSWEFSVNTINIKRSNASWTTNINLTLPDNKLIAFPNLANSPYGTSLIVGQPLTITRAYHFLGVDPASGSYKFSDVHGNSTMTPDYTVDRTRLINTLPKFYGGLQNKVSYKSFEMDFLVEFVKQIGPNVFFNNGTAIAPGVFSSGSSNQPTTVLNRWQKPGDIAAISVYGTNLGNQLTPLNEALSSDAAYSDASFIRLKNVALSYNLSKELMQKMHLQNMSIYFQAQNLLTLTRYKGLDPGNRSLSVLPPLRQFIFGLQIVI